MARIAAVFDAAREVRIVGERTDVTLSLKDRTGLVEDGHVNMPGGEVFYSPVEDSAEGEVTFCEFPAVYFGHDVSGIRFRFERGEIVDASAEVGEEFLLRTLDTDPGARRLGELGIGCNLGIKRYTRNVGFDEKIDGTVHLAIGNSYASNGRKNRSSVHWDLVKDLREGRADLRRRELVQEDGRWVGPAA
jgi:aminopeptidase